MESTVIQEIANQLGMAVDEASKFIETYLPDFAMVQAINAAAPVAMTVTLLIFAIVLSIIYFRIGCYNVFFKKVVVDNEDAAFILIALGVIFIIFAICASVFIPQIIGWLNYPEAMLINMALNAV